MPSPSNGNKAARVTRRKLYKRRHRMFDKIKERASRRAQKAHDEVLADDQREPDPVVRALIAEEARDDTYDRVSRRLRNKIKVKYPNSRNTMNRRSVRNSTSNLLQEPSRQSYRNIQQIPDMIMNEDQDRVQNDL